ncbi:centrosomal protein of 120 kDa [Belonocnema kinseyi]|uniref:centrosomal protein of 120 kDa n=1 Tax=Belonocnema kinseyi TaxID=2817044 RepID=UPI00143DAD49|nr:centrosomal protein of 120 kDa [Belonocnema kinseyi]
MDELVGPNLQIMLSIKEGKGFDKITYPTIIIATINGHSLETNIFEADPNPQYATDLVWEADKTAVRKMRSAQVPLKVECFMLKENRVKEKIGYLLLSVRSAQILTKRREATIKSNWNTLLGLKSDFKTLKPELLISLTIEDQEKNTVAKEDLETNRSSVKDAIVPCLQRDERLIQLGPPETCQDIFLLSITAGMAANLDLLAKEKVGAETTFSFWYRILETDVQLKPFRSNDASSWILNEKIVIRIRSSLSVLKNYLETKPFLLVTLRHKDCTIGQTEVNLQPLVPADNVQEFLKHAVNSSTVLLDQHCLLTSETRSECEGHVRKPYVSLQLKLQYVGIKNTVSESQKPNSLPNSLPNFCTTSSTNDIHFHDTGQITNLLLPKPSGIESHRNPGGDFRRCRTGEPCIFTCGNIQQQSMNCEMIQQQPRVHPHSSELAKHCCNEYSKNVETYRCYCLNVQLNSINLSTSSEIIHHVEFRFHHPKIEIMSTNHPTVTLLSGEKLKLQNIGCKLHFISASEEIKKLLLSFPPKISICDAGKDEKPCLALMILDVQRLFGHNKFECQYEAALIDSDQRKIGDLDVSVYLEDQGPYYRTKKRLSEDNLGPPILDDSLAYKIVEELETWKERQKEIFRAELRKKEERHLNLLSTEWQMRRDNLEAKFTSSVEQCKVLANNLNHATEDLRTRRLQSLEKEARLMKEKEELQCKYNHMMQELKESSYKMQEELAVKVKYLEDQNRVLEIQIEPLRRDNENLKQMVNKQAEKLQIFEKGSLTQDQTASLLQELKSLEEKLTNAQKSKSYFKEQWGKAMREIHMMKMENQQAIELQIKSGKEELKSLNLEDILNAETRGLSTNSQILLGQLQKNMNTMKSKSGFLECNSNDQIFAPVSNIGLKSNRSAPKSELTTRSEEQEEKLRMLIEERDSLLKTGSYTIDDDVIVKLNTEIRSLLIFG